ncbi:DUF1365 domain-containing protein [Maricaulis sp. CAU 1757]
MTPLPASIYPGQVGHTRQAPKHHSLRYGMFSLLTDIDGPERANAANRLLSFDRFNLVSVHARDHGRGDGQLRDWVTAHLESVGVTASLGRIQVLAAPRVLGLIFNPISVYFAFDRADALVGVLFEVNNFHGGRCAYPFRITDPDAPSHRFSCPKGFFVSPFNPVDGVYHFRLDFDETRYRLSIQLVRDGVRTLSAVHTARRETLTTGALARTNIRYPLNTLGIVGAILVEAIRLRLKGLRTFSPRRGTRDTDLRRS